MTRRYASTSTDPLGVAISPNYEYNSNDSLHSFDPYANPTSNVDEHIGYLKELGLDYGWGPTSVVQWCLEHVYIWGELPWGASIVITAVAIRLLLLPLAIQTADQGARLASVSTELAPLNRKLQIAKQSQDQQAMMEVAELYRAKLASSGYSLKKMLMSPLFQVPVGFGTFRLLRGMGTLPVPGFDEGGFLWFTDLSMPDPMGILPITTGLVFFATFTVCRDLTASDCRTDSFVQLAKRSQETDTKSTTAAAVMFRYVIPVFTSVVGLWLPASTQLALFTAALLSASQSLCFLNPGIRRMFGMHPLAQPKAPDGKVINVKANSEPVVQEPEPTGVIAKPAWHIKRFGREVLKLGESVAGKSSSEESKKNMTYEDEERAKAFEQKRQQLLKQRRSK